MGDSCLAFWGKCSPAPDQWGVREAMPAASASLAWSPEQRRWRSGLSRGETGHMEEPETPDTQPRPPEGAEEDCAAQLQGDGVYCHGGGLHSLWCSNGNDTQ